MSKLIKYFSSSLVGLLLFTSLVTPTFAEAIKADSIEEDGFYIELLQEASLLHVESQEKLATLMDGVVLKVNRQGEELFTSWNQGEVLLENPVYEEVDVEMEVDEVGEEEPTTEPENFGTALTTAEVKIFDTVDEDKVLATIENDVLVDFYAQTEKGFIVFVGNLEGYIESTDVIVMKELEEETFPENDGSDVTDEQSEEETEETVTEETPDTEGEDVRENEGEESTENETEEVEFEEEQPSEENSDQPVENTSKSSLEKNKALEVKETVDEETITSTSSTSNIPASRDFVATDKYFVASERLSVYDNSSGKLVHVGYLNMGQVFPRVSDYGSWHKIKYGNGDGFVWKASTVPATQESIDAVKNLNNGQTNSERLIETIDTISVYDNTSGSLVSFAFLFKGITYPVIGDYSSSWVKVDVAGRIGYVYKPATKTPFETTDKYFEVLENNIPIYETGQSDSKVVGYLTKGQVFPRVDEQNGFHRIKFGNEFAFVSTVQTAPSDVSKIKNENKSLENSSLHVVATSDVSVYDNSSGSLVLMGTMLKGTRYPIISQTNSWITVDLGGRIGKIYKPATRQEFVATDEYFQVIQDRVTVYSNSTGALLPVGHLIKGQSYKRVSDFGSWHRIKYGNGYGFVWKEATTVSTSSAVPNQNPGKGNSDRKLSAIDNLTVYDNSTGTLLPFGSIRFGESYPIIRDYSSAWYEVDFAGRLGYVYKPATHEGPIYNYTQYELSLSQLSDIQYKLNPPPQTDRKYQLHYFTRSDGLDVVNGVGTVNKAEWNVRTSSDTASRSVGVLRNGNKVTVAGQELGRDGYIWYKVNMQWVNALPEDAIYYMNPDNFERESKSFYQFLVLSKPAGATAKELNDKILINKGTLTGNGQSFVDAAKKYSINELYLISHAFLETGHGKSSLATGMLVSQVDGQPVTPRIVYNMYGIGATDRCTLGRAQDCGAEFAYKSGWFTPQEAIVGGAEFAAERYVHHPQYKQDTLFKMRWNPGFTGQYGRNQYATDMAWADKQVYTLTNLYDVLDTYENLTFDIPVFTGTK
ncbi:glucosaminidase domain-containing protein [Sutcliffiella horikoshii]|uniref:glucosaminidase domain-containing protein n=1 Tax=Sutcliffiella horikoshii TaxID=79883 RepID=UPI003CF22314